MLPYQREVIWTAYHKNKQSVASLALAYKVSRPTIYKVLKLARVKLLKNPKPAPTIALNKPDMALNAWLRLKNTYKTNLIKKQAKRYNKFYPGEMVHFDSKRLPLLKGQSTKDRWEYLFVAIDDDS